MKIKHIRNGVILISAGLVFLFNNAGWVDWEVWRTVIFWWPAYLIAIGIEVAFRESRLKYLALLSPLIFAFFILGPAWWQWEGREEDRLVQMREWTHPLSSGTDYIQADIEFSLGEIIIVESAASGLNCQMEYRQSEPLISYSEDNDTLHFRLEDQGSRFVGLGFNRAGGTRFFGWDQKNWEVGIDSQTPLKLELESSASRNNLDLSGLVLKELDLDLNAAKANLKIGSKSDSVWIRLDQKASRVDLWLPKESYVIITQDTYIVSDMDSDINLHRSDEDPKPDSSPVIYLSFFGAVCKLNIKTY
ncbi:MAG: DUF5668 domain-containing protein [candidate division Zixibacteria bacterium]|nr:DUF5668 domain-containing protein [candidate division Zixibacteria bacterium]